MIWTHAALSAGLLASSTLLLPAGGGVEWEFGPVAESIAKAKERDTLCLLYFWSEGSAYCGQLYTETLQSEQTTEALQGMVCYSAKHSDATVQLFERYKVATLPTLLFVNGDGEPEDVISGFIPAADFVGECRRILDGEGTVSGLRREAALAAGTPEELDIRWRLAGKLLDVRNDNGHDEQMALIKERDPKGETEIGAQLLFGDVVNQVVKGPDAEDGDGDGGDVDATLWDLAPVYQFAAKIKPPAARVSAWNRIGNLEIQKGQLSKGIAAFQEASKHMPADDGSPDWHNSIAKFIVQREQDMTSKERKLALDYALTAVQRVRKMAADMVAERAAAETAGDQCDEMSDRDPEAMQAPYLNTLALAYHINRKKAKAIATAEQCVKRSDAEDYAKTLLLVRGGHQ
ncbi:MAG: thioredoxin fold domain-containing protein [Planctomycetota bacterium]